MGLNSKVSPLISYLISYLICSLGLTIFCFQDAAFGDSREKELYRNLNQAMIREFLKEFISETNDSSLEELQFFYGSLADKEAEAELVRDWTQRPVLRQDGNALIIESEGIKPVRIEIADIFTQHYIINGRIYQHSWNDPQGPQRRKIATLLAAKGATRARLPFDFSAGFGLMIAPADAQGGVGLAVRLARLCEEGCATVWSITQKSGLQVAKKSAELRGVIRFLGSSGESVLKAVERASTFAVKAGTKIGERYRVFQQNYPHSAQVVRLVGRGVALPVKGVLHGTKTIVLAALSGAGFVLGSTFLFPYSPTAIAFLRSKGIDLNDMLSCMFEGYSDLEECPRFKNKVPVLKKSELDLINRLQVRLCPSKPTNQLHFSTSGKTEIVLQKKEGGQPNNKETGAEAETVLKKTYSIVTLNNPKAKEQSPEEYKASPKTAFELVRVYQKSASGRSSSTKVNSVRQASPDDTKLVSMFLRQYVFNKDTGKVEQMSSVEINLSKAPPELFGLLDDETPVSEEESRAIASFIAEALNAAGPLNRIKIETEADQPETAEKAALKEQMRVQAMQFESGIEAASGICSINQKYSSQTNDNNSAKISPSSPDQ